MKTTPIHTWKLYSTTMSRRGRWRNQQQRQDQTEKFLPRRGSYQNGDYGEIANGGPRLGSYHVTHPTPNAHRHQPIPPHVHNPPYPQYERLYQRPSYPDLRRLKQHLLVCLKELDWLLETENGNTNREFQMDWRPETEVLIPQIEGGIQMIWAWGHERPASEVNGEMEDWNRCGGEATMGGVKRRAEEMGEEVEHDDEGVR